ncbi:hypothetical protein [Viscerimonas tarda]
MANSGYSNRDAQSYALAYILSKYNIGITVSERKSTSIGFKEQKTVKNGSQYEPKICP